jgi:formylglycine-generating enzyme required for sulfatase activity/tRNA A-37 threonylcarbamoyl transferase component Bud32
MVRQDPFGWVGHVLDSKYRVDEVVGEGGFGVVYRAHHLGFQQDVALKCLKLKANLQEEVHDEFLKRFLAEGKLLHQLSRSTADVVQALDVGVATSPSGIETPYLVLEWLEGITLDRELQQRRLRNEPKPTLEEAIALLEPAARGLAHAHDQGISHRDIKPANLMLCDVSGRLTLKVVDFGIAKAPEDADTSSGPFDSLGSTVQAFTPRYGAPEQFSRRYGPTGPWTDVFALALVLVEVVLGEPALEGDDPVQLYIASSDLHRRPTLRAHGIETSDAVERVLSRALAVDPRSRFRTAGEFWDALTEAAIAQPKARSVRPQPITNRPPPRRPVFDRNAPRAHTTSTQGAGTITLILREQRVKKLVWIGAIIATAGIVVGAFWGMSRSSVEAAVDATTPPALPSFAAAASASAQTQDAAPAAPPGMVLVSPARFVMGSDKDTKNERPLHVVTLTHAFYIDRTEVTVEAWGACVRAGKCATNVTRKIDGKGVLYEAPSPLCNSPSDPNLARQPINCVTHEQASAYCAFAGKRLPTEAEWELAARGADSRTFPWGDDPPRSCKQAIVGGLEGPCGKRKGTYDVGTTIDGASPSGALDMAGNVWEWVADGFDTYPNEDVVDPFVPPRGSARGIVRGGSWDYSAFAAKTVIRLPIDRGWAQPNIGFRCAK